jgi:hypothetical protein
MFRSRSSSSDASSLAKAARELERQIMTMEVVSGEESDAADAAQMTPQDVQLPDRLAFGPYGIAPLRGLHYDAEKDTATS